MTAVAVLAGTRRLTWVTWRQHRTSLLVVIGLLVLPAAVMAVTGLSGPWPAASLKLARAGDISQVYTLMFLYLLLLPLVTGLVLGAPLLAHEAESGLVPVRLDSERRQNYLAGRQGAVYGSRPGDRGSRTGSGAQLVGRACAERLNWDWPNVQFSFHPLPYAGWMVFAFCLGVALGAVARRTVPALVGTLVGYVTVFYQDNAHLRSYYLPPLRTKVPVGTEVNNGSFGFSYLRSGLVGRFFVGTEFTRPNGQPIHSAPWPTGGLAGWFNLPSNHVVQWMTYQPASRYALFQVLEFGYLILLSALLVTAAVVLIRRLQAAGGQI